MTEPRLTHVDARGAARMVDVSAKAVTVRTASAHGRVLVSPTVIALLRGEGVPKGDALAVARIAGIQAAKRTPDLVPLCHPIAVHGVEVDIVVLDDAVVVTATVRTAWSRPSTARPSSPTSGSNRRPAGGLVTGTGPVLLWALAPPPVRHLVLGIRLSRHRSPRHEGAGAQHLQPGRRRGL